jgi:GMP synthase-like glutamine amidotransferase
MIIYIDLEHKRLQNEPTLWEQSLADRLKHKYRFEKLSGDHCLLVRYDAVSPAVLDELDAWAVVVSACYTDFEHYSDESLDGLRAIYRQASRPILGICAGMQLMAQSHGGAIGPIGQLGPGELAQGLGARGYVPGARQERGFSPVMVHADRGGSPTVPILMEGLEGEVLFFQSHYWEVKELPSGFASLAKSGLCKIQAIAHENKPIYGVQFHPEEYNNEHPDGKMLLANFFKIAGNAKRSRPSR